MLGRLWRWLRGLFLPKQRKLTEQQLAMQRKAEEDMRRSQVRKRGSFRRADLPPGSEYPGADLQLDDAENSEFGQVPISDPAVPESRPPAVGPEADSASPATEAVLPAPDRPDDGPLPQLPPKVPEVSPAEPSPRVVESTPGVLGSSPTVAVPGDGPTPELPEVPATPADASVLQSNTPGEGVLPQVSLDASEASGNAEISPDDPSAEATAFQQWQEKQEASAGKELSAFQKHRYVRPGETPELNVESPPPAIFSKASVVESGVEKATDSTDGAPEATVVPASPALGTATPHSSLPDVALPLAPPSPTEAPDADVPHGQLPDVSGGDTTKPATIRPLSTPPPQQPPVLLPDVALGAGPRPLASPPPQETEAVQPGPEPRAVEDTTPGRSESLPANDVGTPLPKLTPGAMPEQHFPGRESLAEGLRGGELPSHGAEAMAAGNSSRLSESELQASVQGGGANEEGMTREQADKMLSLLESIQQSGEENRDAQNNTAEAIIKLSDALDDVGTLG